MAGFDSQSYIDGAFDGAGDASNTDATTGGGINGNMIGGGGGVFGDVMNFFGSMLSEDSKTKAAEYNWSLLDQNAQIASAASADAMRRGNIQAGLLRIKGAQQVSGMNVSYAASGVDENSGTAAGMQAYAAGVNEYDAQQVANNAAREAWGFKTQASRFQAQKQQSMNQWQSDVQNYSVNQIGTIFKAAFDGVNMGGG